MAIRWVKGNILDSPAQTLIIPIAGDGLGDVFPSRFKRKFPSMAVAYDIRRQASPLNCGDVYLWKGPDKWILNFVVKPKKFARVKLSYLAKCLAKFRDDARRMGITSAAFPKIGCEGVRGRLDWGRGVKPVIEEYLREMDLDIYVYCL